MVISPAVTSFGGKAGGAGGAAYAQYVSAFTTWQYMVIAKVRPKICRDIMVLGASPGSHEPMAGVLTLTGLGWWAAPHNFPHGLAPTSLGMPPCLAISIHHNHSPRLQERRAHHSVGVPKVWPPDLTCPQFGHPGLCSGSSPGLGPHMSQLMATSECLIWLLPRLPLHPTDRLS